MRKRGLNDLGIDRLWIVIGWRAHRCLGAMRDGREV